MQYLLVCYIIHRSSYLKYGGPDPARPRAPKSGGQPTPLTPWFRRHWRGLCFRSLSLSQAEGGCVPDNLSSGRQHTKFLKRLSPHSLHNIHKFFNYMHAGHVYKLSACPCSTPILFHAPAPCCHAAALLTHGAALLLVQLPLRCISNVLRQMCGIVCGIYSRPYLF